jgi:hypothetical protein
LVSFNKTLACPTIESGFIILITLMLIGGNKYKIGELNINGDINTSRLAY